MAVPIGRVRGLQVIRTHANRVEPMCLPHQVLLQVALLEMEKHRRTIERQAADQRLRMIDQRVSEIKREQEQLMQSVPLPGQPDGRDAERGGGNGGRGQRRAGFRINY